MAEAQLSEVPSELLPPKEPTLGDYTAVVDGVEAKVVVVLVEPRFYRCFVFVNKGLERRGPYQFPSEHWETQIKMWKLKKKEEE